MTTMNYFWIWFFVLIIIMFALDLGLLNKKAKEMKVKEAIIWSSIWIWLALIFNMLIYFYIWKTEALQFFTWYLIEKSLSVDNLFVFIMVFNYFHIKKANQHKILSYWIFGALIMRAVFIFAWVKILETFHFLIYIFGLFLIFTWIKMALEDNQEIDLDKKRIVKLIKKIIPISKTYDDWKFLIKINNKKYATPLLVALIMIEFVDLVFALDSIPAILAISKDMFIVYTSNIFAILGLRALYFALSWIMNNFHYLKYWLAGVLSFVWIKMLISWYYEIPIFISLFFIVIFIWGSIGASYLIKSDKIN